MNTEEEIESKQIPISLQSQALWLIYDLSKEVTFGTYHYDAGELGEITIKLNKLCQQD